MSETRKNEVKVEFNFSEKVFGVYVDDEFIDNLPVDVDHTETLDAFGEFPGVWEQVKKLKDVKLRCYEIQVPGNAFIFTVDEHLTGFSKILKLTDYESHLFKITAKEMTPVELFEKDKI